MGEEKIRLIKDLNSAGVDIDFVIQEAFLGYKYRKLSKKLYEEKAEIPTKLIKMGINDTFGKSGKAQDLLEYYGLTKDSIIEKIM